jgi:hypothetical protein
MKALAALLLLLLPFSRSAPVVEPLYSDEECEDLQRIGSEFVELELSGIRWQGGDSVCLEALRTRTLSSERPVPVSDPALTHPAFILPEGREPEILVKRISGDRLEVKVSYIGLKNGRDRPVRDTAILRLNFGRARELRGCASVFQPFEHLVLRKACHRD